jgi:hypothetical protein
MTPSQQQQQQEQQQHKQRRYTDNKQKPPSNKQNTKQLKLGFETAYWSRHCSFWNFFSVA